MENVSEHSGYDITIVGGGMVGLTAAALAAQQLPNKQICLFETYEFVMSQRPFQPSFDGRSTAISGGSVDILKAIGLWQNIAQHVTEILQVNVSDKGHMAKTSYTKKENGERSLGFVVENAWLGQRLIDHVVQLANVTILAPANVLRVMPKKTGAVVEYQQQNQDTIKKLSTGVVVIADGAESELRNKLQMQATTTQYQQYAVIANVEFEQPHLGQAFERFTEDGPLALLPLGESKEATTCALVWTRNDTDYENTMAWSDSEFLENLHTQFGFKLGYAKKVSERKSYPLQLIFANEQVRSSIVLLGNAAHFLHPVAGQGFNLALRDAARLIEVLVAANEKGKALGDLNVLQSYIDLQKKDQQLTTVMSDNFIRLFMSKNPAYQVVRNVGLLGMAACSPIKQLFFEQMMGKGLPKVKL